MRIAEMEARKALQTWVEANGGLPKASAKLGIPYPTVAAVLNGTRGVGKSLAERLEVGSNGDLRCTDMVWIRPTQAA